MTDCPEFGTLIRGLAACGPSEHVLDPCGCRVTTTTARELAGVDRGRGVATDGGTPTSGTDRCEMEGCENRATGVYEIGVPPAGTIRRKYCWPCAPNVTPVRYLHTDTDREIRTDGGTEQIPDDRLYRDPDGRVLSVVIGNERLRFNEERSSTGHVEFERDQRDMGELDPADRPRVVLTTHSMDPHWTAYFVPEGGSSTDRISLMEHEERTGNDELHLYGEGAPDVTIEYLESAGVEEVDA